MMSPAYPDRSLHTETPTSQYLTFRLGCDEYGINILGVQEIKGYTAVTPLPNTPPHMRGVMNLRGSVVPVVDLRMRFGLADQEYTKFTVIIVVKVHTKTVGLIVDAVSDVLDLSSESVREAPDYGARSSQRFIAGIATVGEKLVVLLEIDKLLSEDELSTTS